MSDEKQEAAPAVIPPAPAQPAAMPPPVTSNLAIACLVCGITGLFLVLPSIAAIILGIKALKNIGKSNGQLTGKGLAIAGLIMGGFTLFLVFIGLVAAIVIPMFFMPHAIR